MMNVKKQAVKSKEIKQQQVQPLSNEQLDNISGGCTKVTMNGFTFCVW